MKSINQSAVFRNFVFLNILVLFILSCNTDSTTEKLLPTITEEIIIDSIQPKINKIIELGKGILPEIVRSSDGEIIITNDGYNLTLLNAHDYEEVSSIPVSEDGYSGNVIFSPNGQYITVSLYGFQVIDLTSRQKIAQANGGNGPVYGQVFTPDSQSVVYLAADRTSGGPYHRICILSLSNEKKSDEYSDCFPVLNQSRYHIHTTPEISPDGKLISAGYVDSTNNILYIWDFATRTIKFEIKEQPSRITSVDFSPDGNLLASSSLDGMIRLWDPYTGTLKRTISGFRDDINNVQFSPDSRKIVVSVANEMDITYDLASGEILPVSNTSLDPLAQKMLQDGYMLSGSGSKILFSPDGKNIALGHGSIQIWNMETRELQRTISNDLDSLSIAGMVFSNDGKHLGVVTVDGNIFSWNVQSGEQELTLSSKNLNIGQALYAVGGSELGPGIGTRSFGEQGIAFSPNGNEIAFGNDIFIDVWDIKSATRKLTLEQTQPVMFPTSVSYSKDGKLIFGILNRNKDVGIWDAETGKLIRLLNLPSVDPNAFSAISLNGHLFARNNYNDTNYWIEIWDLEKNQIVKLPTYVREVEPLRFSTDGKFFAALVGYKLYIWRTDTGKLVFVSNEDFNIGDLAIDPEGKTLATASFGKITLWDIGNYTQKSFQPDFVEPQLPFTPTPWASSYDYPTSTPQPTQIVTPFPIIPPQVGSITVGNARDVIQLAHFGKGNVEIIFWEHESNTIVVSTSQGFYQYDATNLNEIYRFENDEVWNFNSQIISDGNLLIAGATKNEKIQVWNVLEKKIVTELPGNGQPVISPDGSWLVYANGISGLSTWNLKMNQEGNLLRSNSQYSYKPLFSPNGQFVAAIQSDRSIRVWDLEIGTIIGGFGGPEAEITDLSFSHDGNYIAGAAGGSAWVWNLAPSLLPLEITIYEGRMLDNLTLFDNTVSSVAIGPDNNLVAIGTSEHNIWLYNRELGNIIGSLTGHKSTPIELSFNDIGNQLVSVDHDGKMIVWDVTKQSLITSSHLNTGPLFGFVDLDDGSISTWSENTVWKLNINKAELIHTTYVPEGKILAVSPSDDLIAAYKPLQVSLHNAQTGVLTKTLPEEAQEPWVEHYWEGQIFQQYYGAVFSVDGKRLVTLGTGGVWMYELPNGDLVSHLEGNISQKAAISSDGEWVVVSRHEFAWSPSLIEFKNADTIFDFEGASGREYSQYAISPDKLWIGLLQMRWSEPSLFNIIDTRTGRIVKSLAFDDEVLTSLVFSPDATFAVVGQQNGYILFVDLDTMRVIRTIDAHKGVVNFLGFSKDSKNLISGGQDGRIKIWGLP